MKKIVSCILAAVLTVGTVCCPAKAVFASEINAEKTKSEGYAEVAPYGQYLQMGKSDITKVGTGKIYAKGRTIAHTTVSKVSVGVRVERLLGNAWVQQDYFSASKTNTNTVAASKTLTVPIGYFYRVKSIHGANTDSSSSVTDGLYI